MCLRVVPFSPLRRMDGFEEDDSVIPFRPEDKPPPAEGGGALSITVNDGEVRVMVRILR